MIFRQFSSDTIMPVRMRRLPAKLLADNVSPMRRKANRAANTGSMVKISAVCVGEVNFCMWFNTMYATAVQKTIKIDRFIHTTVPVGMIGVSHKNVTGRLSTPTVVI